MRVLSDVIATFSTLSMADLSIFSLLIVLVLTGNTGQFIVLVQYVHLLRTYFMCFTCKT